MHNEHMEGKKEGKTNTANKWERQRDMTGAGGKQAQSRCENKRADKKLRYLFPSNPPPSVSLDI